MAKTAYVIVGPTASGKSDTAVELALGNNGEVISGDSVQVYRGLNIGSGKITPDEMKGVPHHLLDVANPEQPFTAADFRSLGNQALEKIVRRNHTPIIAGGTGFYIDTLVYNTKYPVAAPAIQDELEQFDQEKLQNIAQTELIDVPLNNSELHNPPRLRKKIALYRTYGHLPKPTQIPRALDINFVWLGINPNKLALEDRITKRTLSRLDAGLINEVRDLLNNGVDAGWLRQVGLTYRSVVDHLENKTSIEELKQSIISAETKYAKRQLTWFKRNEEIRWFEDPKQLLEEVA